MRTWFGAVVLLGIAAGIAAGIGTFTFTYARGYSYLLNDPAACANCHVMQAHFDAWTRSSHHAVATCNDCHLPEGVVGAYATKTANGWAHGVAFTTGEFHWPLEAKARSQRVAESKCRTCHQQIVHQIDRVAADERPMRCARCHMAVGHPTR